MAIPLTGTGGLFTRLGRLGALWKAVNLFRGTGSLLVSSISGGGATITVNTYRTHGLSVGDTVVIANSNIAGYNGTFTVATVPTTTQFTITNATTGANTSINVTVTKTAGAGVFSAGSYVDNIEAQYQATNQQLVDSLYGQRDNYRGVHSSFVSILTGIAQQTLIKMADDDVRLVTKDLPTSMGVLISQMTTAAASVQKPTVSAAVVAGGSNSGNAVVTASVLAPNGKQLDYCFNESLTVTCTADSQGTGILNSEQFSVVGQSAATDPTNWDWPLGSAANTTLTNTDASKVGPNLLTNSAFETFTVANTPDNWTIATGTAGTTVFSGGAGAAYTGSNCLQITGNGAELTALTQTFNVATGGTVSTLSPLSAYAVNVWVKVSAVPAAGVLALEMVDGSNVIVNDAAGNPNAITLSLPSATTSYLPLNGYFRTPAVLPATVKFRIRLSTALDNAKSVFLDNLAMVPPNQAYTGGPFLASFSGSVKSIVNDTYTVTISQKYDSQWQQLVEAFFGMRQLGLQLPSSGAPTVAENLIS